MLCDIIFGAKILPEKIRLETAKMFRIKNSDLPTINFMVKKNNDDAGSVALSKSADPFGVSRQM